MGMGFVINFTNPILQTNLRNDVTMSLPELIYLAMGAIIARIILENTSTKGFTSLQWFQFIFDILRIVILWPLVLFLEKFGIWLHSEEDQ
jgi:hypothetical protein